MDSFEKLYTVDDVAKMTDLTSRTIRNYLKDGRLEGKKIGGQWRFTMDNIKNLFDNRSVAKDIQDDKKQQVIDFIDGVNTDMSSKVQVCTVADYYCNNIKEAKEMSEKLLTVINNVDNINAKISYKYIEKESKAQFIMFGDPQIIINALNILNR